MNAPTSIRLLKCWKACCSSVLALSVVFMLAGADAFAQATVTTLANTFGKAGAGKASTKGVLTTTAKFNLPAGIALDSSGTYMFVADYNNNAIRLVYDLGNKASSVTYSVYTNKNGINHPVGVAVDPYDNVFVLNYGTKGANGSLMVFNGDYLLNYSLYAPPDTRATNLVNAAGLTLDYVDNAYITVKSNTVYRVTPLGVTTVVGVITNAKTSLTGIAYLAGGRLAIADAGNNGIWLMDPANTNLFANAVKLTGFHGTNDIIGPAAIAAFNHPQGVIQAGKGVLVVADYGNNKVKLVATNGAVSRLFGVSSSYWKNVRTLATKGWNDGTVNPFEALDTVQARQPYGLAIDASGNVYDTEDYYDLLREATGTGLLPPPPPPPQAPSLNVSAGYGLVNLAWSSVLTATNYNVKRSLTSGGEVTIFSTSGTSYTDTNVVDGSTYYYAVSAVNSTGEGMNSAEASAMPLYSPTPTNLTVTATNYTSVSLAWAPSAGATTYNVKRSTSTGGPYTNVASTASLLYTDTGLANHTTYYYVVSAVNPGGENPINSAEVSATTLTPPPPSPAIGWFDYENFVTVFHAVSGTPYITHNDLLFAIEENFSGASTIYTTDGSNPSATNGYGASLYVDGLSYNPPLPISATPDLVIKALNINAGGSSAIVTAEFLFQTANPTINGVNAAQFTISDATIGAKFLYTTDGSNPLTNVNATLVDPVNNTNALTLSLQFPANTNIIQFAIAAFKANYSTSSVVSKVFSVDNYLANAINFGFASGPGSCQYVASPGQSFVVPVGMSLLPGAPPIYGLQFNLTLTNLTTNVVDPETIYFESLVGKPDGLNDGYYDPIPPFVFISTSQPNNDPAAQPYAGAWYQSLQFANTNNQDLLGVGWLEVRGRTNLYNTLNQNLLTFPINEGTDPSETQSQFVIGGYSFGIPTNANPGDTYQIQINRPSATTYPTLASYGIPVYIAAPADTNLLGPGSVNALKNVTIGQLKYLVGDVYPANWFNAGDFGSSNLVNIDVIRVFDFAAYPVGAPPVYSDLFDALDSSGNIGILDTNIADANYGYYTNTATYPATNIILNAVTNYTDSYVFDTNANSYVLATNDVSFIDNYTNVIYLTTYLVGVPYTITNVYYPVPPGLPTTNIVQTGYVANIAPALSGLFDGNNTNINQVAFGDGVLDVCDVFVTYRRSLDSSLTWYERFWNNGQRVADTGNTNHAAAHVLSRLASANLVIAKDLNSPTSSAPPQVTFAAGAVQGAAGHVVSVPITATIQGNYPLRLLMLNLDVVPQAGASALTTAVQFAQTATTLGTPYLAQSAGNGNYAVAWLNSGNAGVTGTVTIGSLSVAIPAGAASGSTYTVTFEHASASPNGLASFPVLATPGTITVH